MQHLSLVGIGEEPSRSLQGYTLRVRSRDIVETRSEELQRVAELARRRMVTAQVMGQLMATWSNPTVQQRRAPMTPVSEPGSSGYDIAFSSRERGKMTFVGGEELDIVYRWQPAQYGEEVGQLWLFTAAPSSDGASVTLTELDHMIVRGVEYGRSVSEKYGDLCTSFDPAVWPNQAHVERQRAIDSASFSLPL